MHDPDLYVIVEIGDSKAAFWLDEGELIESVEFPHDDGTPDFTEGGPCDPVRGSSPVLQQAVRDLLTAAETEHSAGRV
jgi:hypothetical protein